MSSAASSVSNWDNEYAKVARKSTQLRTPGLATSSSSPQQNQVDREQLSQNLSRLNQSLNSLPISSPELLRRRRLIQNMQSSNHSNNNPHSLGTPGGSGQATTTTMQQALAQQDDMIDELAIGVGRLRDQTQVIGEEARMHVNLLGDMETNLDAAHAGLESETRRAAQLKEDQSVWRLQLTVAGLSVLLVLLILMGLS